MDSPKKAAGALNLRRSLARIDSEVILIQLGFASSERPRFFTRAILPSLKEQNMRKLVALLLPPVIFAQGCASGVPRAPLTSLDAVTLATVNRAIEGQPVSLYLANGEVVKEVEDLTMTAETTSWLGEHDRIRTVPTSEVCKVILQTRFRAGKGYAWGLLACAPVAYAVGDATKDPLEGLFALLLTEALCPLIGIAVSAGLREPPDRVVYSAPGSCGAAH
jgi:hypothetical protein